jgi:hypothetical protein
VNDALRGRSGLLLFLRHCLVRVRVETWKTFDGVWSLAGIRIGYLRTRTNYCCLTPPSCTDMGWSFSCVCCGKILIIALMEERNGSLWHEFLV